MRPRTTLTAFALALIVSTLAGTVGAQERQNACGDFNFREQPPVTLSAQELAVDLGLCDVHVTNVIVEGDVILGVNSKEAVTTVDHKLVFQNVEFSGKVSFGGTTFEKLTVFEETKFRATDFEDAIFEVEIDVINATFESGVNLSGTTFKGPVILKGTTFEKMAVFDGTIFGARADFSDTIFGSVADFSDATFGNVSDFSDATFGNVADFSGTTFEGDGIFSRTSFEREANFRDASFNGLRFNPTLLGQMWPPNTGNITTDLLWDEVKQSFPDREHIINMHGRWENFFILGSKFVEAEQVRTSRRRLQLHKWIWRVGASFMISWLVFIPAYYWRFRNVYRRSNRRHILKLVLFSLDVISPSIRPWKYDWVVDGRFPVRKVVVLTAVESAAGWILLGLVSAIAVAWLTA